MVMYGLFCIVNISFAALDTYVTLAPLPYTTKCGGNTGTKCETDLSTYLPGVFKFSIGIAAALAFIMITFGGIEYMTSDAISGKSDGRKRIEEALWGLLFVIGAWAILNTINPQILDFNLTVPRPNLTYANMPTVAVISGSDLADDATNRNALEAAGVKTYAGACTGNNTTGCVNLNGLQKVTIDGVESLQQLCKATQQQSTNCVVIKGGTEGGHATNSAHATGNALDLEANTAVNNTITNGWSNNSNICQTSSGGACSGAAAGNKYTIGNAVYVWEPKDCCGTATAPASTGDHWHVTYK